jgi:farnesyl-diphosphate farnesyltransferase
MRPAFLPAMTDSTDTLLGHLSLRVLPPGLRVPVSLAYLLARAADTVADTPGTGEAERLARLTALRERIAGNQAAVIEITDALSPDERTLLEAMPAALQLLQRLDPVDAAAVRRVVSTLIDGMSFDLRHFAGATAYAPVALRSADELDRYTYLVAGCVGEFWTEMAMRHSPALRHWNADQMAARGIDYGRALQLTNVLRDCGDDLAAGRCYLPLPLMPAAVPGSPVRRDDALAARAPLMQLALSRYRKGAAYVLAIPRFCVRLRLASLWPLLIGLATLRELGRNTHWPDPARRS